MRNSKAMQALRADPKVADVENEGMEEGRFFVHLKNGWRYTYDGSDADPVRTRSFSNCKDAAREVRTAVAVKACCDESLPPGVGKYGCANCNGDNA